MAQSELVGGRRTAGVTYGVAWTLVVKHENFSATKLHGEKALSTRRRLATERHDDKRGQRVVRSNA